MRQSADDTEADTSGSTGVVVAGTGAVTAFGTGVDALWKGVLSGETAIGPVTGWNMTGLCTGIGGQVPEHARVGRYASEEPALEYLLTAAAEAMSAAGLDVVAGEDCRDGGARPGIAADRWGVVIGSCNGGMQRAERALRDGDRSGLTGLSPQVLAETLGAEYGITGPVLSVNTACASSAHALAHSVELIRSGRTDAVLVGGTDAFSTTAFAGFHRLGALSARPAAPYSQGRDGLSLGEGSGVLVLVAASLLPDTSATVPAHLLGYGLSADGYHATAPHPDGEGAARAVRAALDHAGLRPQDVRYVNGHGTGTRKNDPAESNAVRAAMGEAAGNVSLSSTKSMVGHLLGAAGAVEAIVTVRALLEQQLPPTANLTALDPKCGLDPVRAAVPADFDAALSNNFAFGGANATVAFGRQAPLRPERRRHPDEPLVITGIGLLTPAGATGTALWDAFSAPSEGSRHAAAREGMQVRRVDFQPDAYVTRREQRRTDRLGLLAVAAARSALENAAAAADDRTGVVLGTGLGPVDSMARFTLPVLADGPDAGSPAVFPNTVYNAAAGQVAQLLGARGATSTLTADHAAGATALCVAAELLRAGQADSVIALGTDLVPQMAEDVYRSVPLFGGRAGRHYRLSEAGIAVFLERASAARRRGARVLGVLGGYGMASDARGPGRWCADGSGVERAMRSCLDEGGCATPETVWLNAAGLSAVDRPERAAVERLWPASRDCPRLLAPKRVLGDPVGAGAQLLTALALLSFERNAARGPALVNSSSFGGTHVSLLLRPGTER